MTPLAAIRSSISGLTALAFASAVLAGPAWAQGYPTRNITLVLPFAAGSGTDTTTRLIAAEVGKALGQQLVVENKPGANGILAATHVARSAPANAAWTPSPARRSSLRSSSTSNSCCGRG